MLLSAGATAIILLALMFYGFWRFRHKDDVDIEHRPINPDIPPQPVMPPDAADIMTQKGEQVKQQVPLGAPVQQAQHVPSVNQQPVQQTGSVPPANNQHATQPAGYVPPQQPTVQQANDAPQPQDAEVQQNTPVYSESDPLTERAEILDANNPIAQPPTYVDADIPDIPRPSEKYNSSDYGVRDASNRPGRILRHKRYERNAAD